jgi:hypothetical protein
MITLHRLLQVNLTDYVAVHTASAHPHYDADGTVHNIGNCFKGGPKICIIKIPPKKGTFSKDLSLTIVLIVLKSSLFLKSFLFFFGVLL